MSLLRCAQQFLGRGEQTSPARDRGDDGHARQTNYLFVNARAAATTPWSMRMIPTIVTIVVNESSG